MVAYLRMWSKWPANRMFVRTNGHLEPACEKALHLGGVARIHVRAASERRLECASASPSRLASLIINAELGSRPSWPGIFRWPVAILSPLFCSYPHKIYGKRRELDSLEQLTPQSEKSPQWPLCMITSDEHILPPRLVCVLNSLHPPSFCIGILFECTTLGINLYKTSRIYNRELTNWRLSQDDAVGLRERLTAHAYLGTCRRRAKVDAVVDSDSPAS